MPINPPPSLEKFEIKKRICLDTFKRSDDKDEGCWKQNWENPRREKVRGYWEQVARSIRPGALPFSDRVLNATRARIVLDYT